MKNITKIIVIICIIVIIISVGIIVFKYMQQTSSSNIPSEEMADLEKYTQLEELTSNDFDLKSCIINNYYTIIETDEMYNNSENDCIIYHKDELDNFIANVNSNIPDVIRVIQYSSDEKNSFIKDIEFTQDKFIIKDDYRFFSNREKGIVTNEYSTKDYKFFIDENPIKNENAKVYYRTYLKNNENSNLIYLFNYFEIPEDNESKFELEFIKDMTKERQLILSKSENTKYDYDIYSYNGDVNIIIENEKYTLREALLSNKITAEDIIESANKDVEKNNIFRDAYLDGGTVEYTYNNYIILKYNNLAGNKDLYIGDISMNMSNLNKIYYNSYMDRPVTY